nr:MAG TPA: hypothetical protein [Caudoviricetes sp.]
MLFLYQKELIHMRAPGDLFIWKENDEWWDIDEEKNNLF